MFSLIITIISIALVALLALATLYYGGSAFSKGNAEAEAAKILLQGQQILGAAELYKAEKGAWPVDLAKLVTDGYLKSIPISGTGAVSESFAEPQAWKTVSDYRPVYVKETVLPTVCQGVNKKAYGIDGVLKQMRLALVAQCYGDDNTKLQVVFAKSTEELALAVTAPNVGITLGTPVAGGPPTTLTGGEWQVVPPAAVVPPPNGVAVPPVNVTGPGPVVTLGSLELSYSKFTVATLTGDAYWRGPMLTIKNIGTGVVDLTTLTFSDQYGNWYIYEGDCQSYNNGWGWKDLQAGESCYIYWEFDGLNQPGVAVQTITINYDQGQGPQTTAVVITATVTVAPADFTLNPGSLEISFEPANLGLAKTGEVVVSNRGATPVSGITAIASGLGFSQTNNCTETLQQYATCTITVAVTPAAAQDYSGTLTVAATGVAAKTVSLTGKYMVPVVTQLILTRTSVPDESSYTNQLYMTWYDGSAAGGDVAKLMTGGESAVHYLVNGGPQFLLAYGSQAVSGVAQKFGGCGNPNIPFWYGFCGTPAVGLNTPFALSIDMPYGYPSKRDVALPASSSADGGAWCITWRGPPTGQMTGTAVSGLCPGFSGFNSLQALPNTFYMSANAGTAPQSRTGTLINSGTESITGLTGTVVENGSGFSVDTSNCGATLSAFSICQVRYILTPLVAPAPGGISNVSSTATISGSSRGQTVFGSVALSGGIYSPSPPPPAPPPQPAGTAYYRSFQGVSYVANVTVNTAAAFSSYDPSCPNPPNSNSYGPYNYCQAQILANQLKAQTGDSSISCLISAEAGSAAPYNTTFWTYCRGN